MSSKTAARPKPNICPIALEKMRLRVKGRPWSEVKKEEDRLWASKNDCPDLGLKRTSEPEKPRAKPIGEKLATPLTEPLTR